MRLLNTSTLELHQFVGDEKPKYAILSHTWGKEEVQFNDISKPKDQLLRMAGFFKIQKCCTQALDHGLDYAWVDTCCINKDSSAELSEAINSMYRWYQNAHICYAYLQDVNPSHETIGHSRWFRRGWTLQELVAPSTLVIFCNSEWQVLGDRESLRKELVESTGIQADHLDYPHVCSFPIA